jgi:hypothetical protein
MFHNCTWFPIYFNFDITDWKKSLLLIGFIQKLPLLTGTLFFYILCGKQSRTLFPYCKPWCKAHYLDFCKDTVWMLESLKQSSLMVTQVCFLPQWSNLQISMSFVGNRSKPKNQQQNHTELGSGTVEHHARQMCPLAYKFWSSILGLLCWGCLQH